MREPADMPPDVVTMNSTVRFKMPSSGNEFCLTLVYPKDVQGDGRRSPCWPRSAAPCSA